MNFKESTLALVREAEEALREQFAYLDAVSYEGTRRVMAAFSNHRVSDAMFAGTTGYGYNDKGRETLDEIFAEVFECEAAIVRHSIVNGTQALAIGLYGLLRPGDVMLSVTGKPYDTLEEVIGIAGEAGNGSLADFGILYREIAFSGTFDYEAIAEALKDPRIKMVYVQRSKGYLDRPTLSSEAIGELARFVKARSDAYIYVDNCYGEFTSDHEPTYYGVDLMAGSLIKNAGGGMAQSGGYLAGTKKAVELASYRLTTVGVGGEVGATFNQNRDLFKGFFYEP
ncbi:MAG: methionine gamma-lyase family protein, partial [Clostridia bacterium]|nr:methionine gamma-lyase family protein [Clostridia bacterium]